MSSRTPPLSPERTMPKLEERTVALLESRKSDDLASLVQRLGGTAVCVPSVREVLREQDFQPMLARLVRGEFDIVVTLTAAACDALFTEAERYGVIDAVLRALASTTIAARGPKPLLSLRRRGLAARIVTDKPHTSDELLDALRTVDLLASKILLLHYGERSESLSASLAGRGARVEDLSLYDWALPADLAPLHSLIDDTLRGRIDAMLFTSQVQLRHLLQVADAAGRAADLTRKLRDEVIVGSVGPVCSRALRVAGIVPDVMPHLPNGPSLVQALGDYYSMFTPSEEITS
jgi:uroporphyrinogen-III synthase